MYNDKNNEMKTYSSSELELLDAINKSYLNTNDVKWLKNKKWFKRYLKVYLKELIKKDSNNIAKEKIKTESKEDGIEFFDFTKRLRIPPEEVMEILQYTKNINITDINMVNSATKRAKKIIKIEKAIWTLFTLLALFTVLILSVVIVNWCLENKKTNDILDTIQQASEYKEVKTTSNKSTTSSNKESDLYKKYGAMSIIDVNFDNLKEINKDTVGWIKVNGTKINYPFVKTDNNEYYLKHSFDKTSNKKGWVFLDFRNDIDNLSNNNILYAHGLVNNEMFGSMRNVIKKSWYEDKKNHIIQMSTLTSNLTWLVFSSYTTLPESYYITTYFQTDDEYVKFLETIKSRSVYDYGVSLTSNDKKKRMVLHAKLIKSEKK